MEDTNIARQMFRVFDMEPWLHQQRNYGVEVVEPVDNLGELGGESFESQNFRPQNLLGISSSLSWRWLLHWMANLIIFSWRAQEWILKKSSFSHIFPYEVFIIGGTLLLNTGKSLCRCETLFFGCPPPFRSTGRK